MNGHILLNLLFGFHGRGLRFEIFGLGWNESRRGDWGGGFRLRAILTRQTLAAIASTAAATTPAAPVETIASGSGATAARLAHGFVHAFRREGRHILADALQDAGCENEGELNHCRQPGEHVRGCWVVDLLTGKE